MKDFWQRDLAEGDRVTVPGVVTSIVGDIVAVTTLVGETTSKISLQSGNVLRANRGDNNGIDDSITEDVSKRADEHFQAEIESRREVHAQRLAAMDTQNAAELQQKRDEHAQRMANVDK